MMMMMMIQTRCCPLGLSETKLLWVLQHVSLAESYASYSHYYSRPTFQYVYRPTKTIPVQFKCKSESYWHFQG
jgi:hypothetical protein